MPSSVCSWTDDGTDDERGEEGGDSRTRDEDAPSSSSFPYGRSVSDLSVREARDLFVQGFVVVRVFPEEDCATHRRRFDAALRGLREYRSSVPKGEWQYAKTGFGALATPSSYHNEAVRYMRLAANERVLDALAVYDQMQTRGLCGSPETPWQASRLVARKRARNGRVRPRLVQMLVDRMGVRVAGQQPGAESWHRDVGYTGADDAVTIFGGWLALTDQHASLVPGTHTGLPGPAGFAELGKEEKAEADRSKMQVDVPAGCLLLMHQNIVHEVVSRKHVGSEPMRRVYTGWRLAYDRRPLCEHVVPRGRATRTTSRRDGPAVSLSLDEAVARQSGFKLPSDQFPDLYNEKSVDMPVQHAGLRKWLDAYVRPELYQEIRRADGSVKFEGGAPPRHMLPVSSVQDGAHRAPIDVVSVCERTGQRPYPPYSDVEVAILKPASFGVADSWREESAARRFTLAAFLD